MDVRRVAAITLFIGLNAKTRTIFANSQTGQADNATSGNIVNAVGSAQGSSQLPVFVFLFICVVVASTLGIVLYKNAKKENKESTLPDQK